MAPRLSGQTSIFGVVFFVSKSLLGIERQKKLEKFAILTRKPRSHVRILIYRTWPIHNRLWTWHDKCNICCRYCIYHVKFNVCLVTKPLEVFSSETKWLNASLLFLRMNYMCKCIIKQLLISVFAWYHELSKPRVCVICLNLRLRQITQTSVLIIHDIMLNLIQ